MQKQRMWGVGSTNVTKYGKPGSHRAKPIGERYGKFTNDAEITAFADSLGLSVKRVQRDLTLWRKTGRVPSWA